ncbi:MAG: LysR family transcriptional regulator [Elainellaceae cyanobacterium]
MNQIDSSRLKLSQLRALAAVAECGSFGRAALELGVTQSSVSHAIASLEEILGVELLFRGRQGATLTLTGEVILKEIQPILARLEAVVQAAHQARGMESGQVRIASIRSLATHWLPPVLALFHQRHPQLTVTVTKCFDYHNVRQALRDRTADVGLMDVYDTEGLMVRAICEDDYVVLLPPSTSAAPAAPMGYERTISWQEMSQHDLIMPAANDGGYAALRQYLQATEVPLTVAYEINEDAMIVSLVAQGLGMAILPRYAARPIPEAVRVRHLPQPLTRTLAAVTLSEVMHSPAVFAFLEQVEQWCSGAR